VLIRPIYGQNFSWKFDHLGYLKNPVHRPKSSKRPITRQQMTRKLNHSMVFNNSLSSIVWTYTRSKNDRTLGDVPSSDLIERSENVKTNSVDFIYSVIVTCIIYLTEM
jgi:hypothetical protein